MNVDGNIYKLTHEELIKKGDDYFYGTDCIDVDYAQAVYYYRIAAEAGSALAQVILGECLHSGNGVEQNLEESIFWFRKSAEQGNAEAQCNLGICYYEGEGVEYNLKEALFWLRKSAEQGNAFAQYFIGYCYQNGKGYEINYDEAIYWYQLSVNNDGEHALIPLCDLLHELKHYKDALKWLKLAYEKNIEVIDTRRSIIRCLYNIYLAEHECCGDNFLKIDDIQDLSDYELNDLGLIHYKNGEYNKAVLLFTIANEFNYPDSINNLGLCYEYGLGVDKDYNKAFKLYHFSADLGCWKAFLNLGLCYQQGIGISQDISKAMAYYEDSKFSIEPSLFASINKGIFYEYGWGVEKDYRKAFDSYDDINHYNRKEVHVNISRMENALFLEGEQYFDSEYYSEAMDCFKILDDRGHKLSKQYIDLYRKLKNK